MSVFQKCNFSSINVSLSLSLSILLQGRRWFYMHRNYARNDPIFFFTFLFYNKFSSLFQCCITSLTSPFLHLPSSPLWCITSYLPILSASTSPFKHAFRCERFKFLVTFIYRMFQNYQNEIHGEKIRKRVHQRHGKCQETKQTLVRCLMLLPLYTSTQRTNKLFRQKKCIKRICSLSDLEEEQDFLSSSKVSSWPWHCLSHR